ncbi:MAG: hypothetical protein ACSHYB_14790 [Roseibacillus sp.]
MTGPCPNCQTTIQGPNHFNPPQPQPLNPPQEDVPTLYPQDPSEVALSSPVAESSPPERAPIEVSSPAPIQEQPEPDPSPIREPLPASKPYPNPLSSNQRPSGLTFAQAFALCFVSSLIFFALGFVLGKSGAVKWDQILEKAKAQQPTASSDTNLSTDRKAAVDTPIIPLEVKPADPTQELSTAQATLEAFLAADTWGARNAYALNSKAVLPMMAANATVHGDGPIPFESITLHTEGPNMRVFWVKTNNHPLPFSVVMLKEDDWWLVDWPGFADFYYDRLGAFSRGREGPMKGVFRVLLKAAPGETSPLSPSRCLVRAPHSPTSYQVNSLAESPARRKLAEIFQAYQQGEPERFKDAITGDGIPLILEISRSGAQNPTLQLEQVITTGWPPLSAQQTEKDTSSRFY